MQRLFTGSDGSVLSERPGMFTGNEVAEAALGASAPGVGGLHSLCATDPIYRVRWWLVLVTMSPWETGVGRGLWCGAWVGLAVPERWTSGAPEGAVAGPPV